MGRAYRGIYTYAWDLAEEGVAEVTAKFRDVGATTVTLATSYHAGKFLRPQGTKGRVAIVDDGTVYFRAKPESYGRVKPVLHPMLESFDPLRALAETAPDLDRVAWTVCCHNTRLGTAYPDLVAVNCFGDPYPTASAPLIPKFVPMSWPSAATSPSSTHRPHSPSRPLAGCPTSMAGTTSSPSSRKTPG